MEIDAILQIISFLSEKWEIPLLVLLLLGYYLKSGRMKPYQTILYVRRTLWGLFLATAAELLAWPVWKGLSEYPQCPAWAGLVLPVGGLLLFSGFSLYFAKNYRFYQKALKKSKELETENPIEAWRLLKTIPESCLTPGQRTTLQRRALYQLSMLGNTEKALRIAKDMEQTDAPLSHMIFGLQALESGDINQASIWMLKAQGMCTAETEPYIQAQILTNCGVMKVCQGHFIEADYYFKQTRELMKEYGEHSMRILEPFYYNYAFNCCRLQNQDTTWEQALAEYRGLVDLTRAEGFLSVCNLEWELMRQAKTAPEIMEAQVQKAFSKALSMDLSRQKRCVFEGSMARMVCNQRMNPEPCLKALHEDWKYVRELPMPARYETMKYVDMLFRDLGSDRLLEQYCRMDRDCEQYMSGPEAEKDMKAYLDTLPVEAVKERCYCERELAALKKQNLETYCFEKVRDQLEGVVAVCLENHLDMTALDVRLAIVDESIFPLNLTDHHKPIYPEEMRKQISLIEKQMESMAEHPKLAECALRLSYYFYHLDDYRNCIRYFEQFKQMDVPLEHFAVWLHRYYTACALVTHILRFYEAILKIREDHGKLRIYDAKVQEWFTRFPDSDGFHATLLLGKWCGCDKIPSKIKFWYANNPEGAPLPQQDVFISTPNDANLRAHCWFFMPFGNLDVDLTYEQFHADRDASCILFSGGHHPFEVEESWELLQHNRESRVSFHEILRREMTWGELLEETRTLLEKVYAVIQLEVR